MSVSTIRQEIVRARTLLSVAWGLIAPAVLSVSAVLSLVPGVARAADSEVRLVSRSEDEQRTIQAYRDTKDAVVFIVTKSITLDPFEAYPALRASEGSGSGIVVDGERAILITNLHVIQDAAKIEVLLADGRSYPARLLGYDREYDIAVLQVKEPPGKLAGITFGDSSRLDVGQKVLAIGNPFGLNRTLTTGIISSLDRVVKTPEGALMKGLIQTDAAINPGNSGGPLLDGDGRLIGMNTAILSQSGDSAGIGFAVPINQIKRVLPDLIRLGRILRPSLGWLLDDTDQGAMVRWVARDGPAAQAGVEAAYRAVQSAFLRGYVLDYSRADLVYSVNGTVVSNREEVEDAVARSESGAPIELVLRRGGINGRSRMISIKPVMR